MPDSANRRRPLRKTIALSEAEWERVERRMVLAGSRSFGEFARDALLEGRLQVVRIAFDPAPLRVELSRIGNNVNQIARHVNVDDVVTVEEMHATRELLRQVQRLLDQVEGVARGAGDKDRADQDDSG